MKAERRCIPKRKPTWPVCEKENSRFLWIEVSQWIVSVAHGQHGVLWVFDGHLRDCLCSSLPSLERNGHKAIAYCAVKWWLGDKNLNRPHGVPKAYPNTASNSPTPLAERIEKRFSHFPSESHHGAHLDSCSNECYTWPFIRERKEFATALATDNVADSYNVPLTSISTVCSLVHSVQMLLKACLFLRSLCLLLWLVSLVNGSSGAVPELGKIDDLASLVNLFIGTTNGGNVFPG